MTSRVEHTGVSITPAPAFKIPVDRAAYEWAGEKLDKYGHVAILEGSNDLVLGMGE